MKYFNTEAMVLSGDEVSKISFNLGIIAGYAIKIGTYKNMTDESKQILNAVSEIRNCMIYDKSRVDNNYSK